MTPASDAEAVVLRAAQGGAFEDLKNRWTRTQVGSDEELAVEAEILARAEELIGRTLTDPVEGGRILTFAIDKFSEQITYEEAYERSARRILADRAEGIR